MRFISVRVYRVAQPDQCGFVRDTCAGRSGVCSTVEIVGSGGSPAHNSTVKHLIYRCGSQRTTGKIVNETIRTDQNRKVGTGEQRAVR